MSKVSNVKKIRAMCCDWTSEGNSDEWFTRYERFTVHTWPFGPQYQCVVNVDYSHAKEPVRIGLPISPTLHEAMKKGINWIWDFKEKGMPAAEEYIASLYSKYGLMYQYRYQILEQMFLVIGNGYYWLDGGLITDPYEEREMSPQETELDRMVASILKKKKKTIGPHPDHGAPRRLYPVHPEYSNIFSVPDDVKDDWLQVAYEAAILLRDKTDMLLPGGEENYQHGCLATNDLETRFGDRLYEYNV